MAEYGGFVGPDGGWGWLVVFASFLLQALTIGVTYTFGLLYVELKHYFNEGDSTTAWIGSIQSALLYFTGVLCGPLLKTFSWRSVVITGVVLSSVGLCLSALTTNIYMLYFTYGVLTGIGYGVIYVTSVVIIQHYFDKQRTLATGIAVSGSGVGVLGFGFANHSLLLTFDWRYTLLIQAGLTLVVGTFCATLFRPLEKVSPSKETDSLIDTKASTSDCQASYNTFSNKRSPSQDSICGRSSRPTTPTIPEVPSADEEDVAHLEPNKLYCEATTCRETSDLTERTVRGDKEGDTTRGNDTVRPPARGEDVTASTSAGPIIVEDRSCCACCSLSLCKLCEDTFRISLCKDPKLVLYAVTLTLFSFGYHVPYTFTPDRAMRAYGIPSDLAAMLISIMGMSNIACRLLIGWVGDKSQLVRFVLSGGVMIGCGVVTTVSFLLTTFPLQVVYSVLFGAFSGCFASMYPVVMVDLFGIEVIEYALGLNLAAASIAFLAASPLSGWVIQMTGGYTVAYMMVGVAHIVGGFIFFSIKLFPKSNGHNNGNSNAIHSKRPRYFSESIA